MLQFLYLLKLSLFGIMVITPIFVGAVNEPAKKIDIQYREKQSLVILVNKLQSADEIAKQFLDSKKIFEDEKKPIDGCKNLVKKNESALRYLYDSVDQGLSFVRGEIENEKTLNGVLSVVQIGMIKTRLWLSEKEFQKAMMELNYWLKFSASFPYDDSTLVSLRLANLIRSLVFDEIELIEKSRFLPLLSERNWLAWLETINIGWPIDRVVVTEGKKILNQRLVPIVFRVAGELQKNPYQSGEQILKRTRGGAAKDLEFIKLMWREEEILALKTEVNRLSAMKIRFASQIFEKKKAVKPADIQSLVDERILNQIPVNYLTGKPFELSQAALH